MKLKIKTVGGGKVKLDTSTITATAGFSYDSEGRFSITLNLVDGSSLTLVVGKKTYLRIRNIFMRGFIR